MMWLVGVSLNLEENPYALWLPPKRSVVWSSEEWELDNETHCIVLYQWKQQENHYMYGQRSRKDLKKDLKKKEIVNIGMVSVR